MRTTTSERGTNGRPTTDMVLARQTRDEVIERVVVHGDLEKLSPSERSQYYLSLCETIGVSAALRPFEYLKLDGRLVLYARKECTDQLRTLRGVSVRIVSRERQGDVYIVVAEGKDATGRTDESTGAVALTCQVTRWNDRDKRREAVRDKDGEVIYRPLRADEMANAVMKAECVPLDSEILTKDGWKSHGALTIGEPVLAYDVEKNQCRWTPLDDVTIYPDAAISILRSTKGQFSVRCTPNHSWAVRKGGYEDRATGSRGARGPYANRRPDVRLVEAQAINAAEKIVLAAPECETELGPLDPFEAALLGWAVTDGTIQRRGSFVRVGICQSKEENFDIIREIVRAVAGGPVHEVIGAATERTFPTGRTYATLPQHWWYMPSEIGRTVLRKAGFESRADLPRIVTRLAPKARSAMLQAMMLAEGDARGTFANGDRHIMDAFEILSALEGRATGSLKIHGPIWTKRLKKTLHVAGSFLSMAPAGRGPVWCPTTRLGTWVMRQDGRVMITGNTKAKRRVTLSLCALGMPDESEVADLPGAEPHVEPLVVEPAPVKPREPGAEG